MKISNLRIERKTGKSYLVADVDCSFSDEKTLWFSVDEEYEQWLTDDVYDAFMVAAIWPCMCYGEDIEIDGLVTHRIYYHIVSYLIPLIQLFKDDYKAVELKVGGFGLTKKSQTNIIGTGFSGGIDSFTTIFDRYENEKDSDYRINALFFFNIGQNGNIKDPATVKRTRDRYLGSKHFPDEIGMPYIFTDSNLFSFYKPHWEYDAGALCRATAILVFQKVCSVYYLSSSFQYFEKNKFDAYHTLEQLADGFIYYWLSPEKTQIILDGGQYTRVDKIERIKDYGYIKKYLNVCVNPDIDVAVEKNCSICHKCCRTLIVIESLGLLSQFNDVFDIDKYLSNSWYYKSLAVLKYNSSPYLRENVDFAKAHGVKMPSKLRAWLNLFPQRLAGFVHRKFK